MKVNRESVVRAGLTLLNEVGLEALTLRLLAKALDVQAATLYWHFENKQALLDAMATLVLAGCAPMLVPAKRTVAQRQNGEWGEWAMAFGMGLRKTLLAYRDGARMVAGSRLTDTEYMKTSERIARHLVESGLTTRQVVVLMSTIYNYTQSFVMEEQAVFPRPGERLPQYEIEERNAALDAEEFPLMRRAGAILFDRFDRRFKEGLELIVRGARPGKSGVRG